MLSILQLKKLSHKGPVQSVRETNCKAVFCCSAAKLCLTLYNPMNCNHKASWSFTNSQSLLKPTSIEWVISANHLILFCLFFLFPSIFPSIRVCSHESALRIKWPKFWSFSISPSNEYLGLISFRIDWFDLLVVQWTLKESSPAPQFKSSNSWCSAFFIAQFSHLYVYHLHIWGCWYFSRQS